MEKIEIKPDVFVTPQESAGLTLGTCVTPGQNCGWDPHGFVCGNGCFGFMCY